MSRASGNDAEKEVQGGREAAEISKPKELNGDVHIC